MREGGKKKITRYRGSVGEVEGFRLNGPGGQAGDVESTAVVNLDAPPLELRRKCLTHLGVVAFHKARPRMDELFGQIQQSQHGRRGENEKKHAQ